MLSMKALLLAVLLSFSLSGPAACDAQKRGNVGSSNQTGKTGAAGNSQPDGSRTDNAKGDLKTLAEGQHSSVTNAFIFTARDVETYNALRKLVTNLPEQSAEFFKSNQVVAAFLGERRTGGYSVRFTLPANRTLRVSESAPPKDSMTTQAITYPFAVVSVPVSQEQALTLELGSVWNDMTRAYQVTGGEFTMSGGIMGRSEKFGVTGSIYVMREGGLATFLFSLGNSGGGKPRLLREVVTGVVGADGRVSIASMSAGSFVDPPADALKATGQFTENEGKLSLTFESIPGQIADGFNGRGTLNASATGPAPAKNR
ncbi:MAG TPA: protease complex subunit PrcB family protein [Pyrinomonadaceae bacterium]|nr:protease complex subunit PrcB family protein [Pyrinomonadaceae bacterium]